MLYAVVYPAGSPVLVTITSRVRVLAPYARRRLVASDRRDGGSTGRVECGRVGFDNLPEQYRLIWLAPQT
jgi:hypothetical protein